MRKTVLPMNLQMFAADPGASGGAVGILDESKEDRIITKKVIKLLKKKGTLTSPSISTLERVIKKEMGR